MFDFLSIRRPSIGKKIRNQWTGVLNDRIKEINGTQINQIIQVRNLWGDTVMSADALKFSIVPSWIAIGK